ncbi:hypothetical protein LTR95_003674 [Oleoguttula sp. CCFEE 5521]
MLGLRRTLAVAAATLWSLASAHTVITYPGWRGNNLHANGTPADQNPNSIGIDHYENGTVGFPFGMQWMYPCGGMPLTQNRSRWPVNGGAVSIQPGWFPGHSLAMFYINIGIQEEGMLAPPNMSHPVVPPFQISGPTNVEYDGQFCIPQVGMPANLSLQVGQNITLQVIEAAQHGAALYSCVDLTLVDPADLTEEEQVGPNNCYNSSDLGFNLVYTMSAKATSGASSRIPPIGGLPAALFATLFATAAMTLC